MHNEMAKNASDLQPARLMIDAGVEMRYTVLMLAMFCCGCQKGDQKVVVTQETAASKDSEELKTIPEEAVVLTKAIKEKHTGSTPP